jgi:hypothetical protein
VSGPGEEWEPEGEDHAPRQFEACDLTDLIRNGVPAPRLICHNLLYPNGVHSLAAEPDVGKTTFAWWCAVQIMRDGGLVCAFDEECGPEMTAEKLIGLGATEEQIERQLRYHPFPARMWHDADILALTEEVDKYAPSLVIFDSSAAFMARADLDENVSGDVTRFYLKVVRPLAVTHRSAVIVLDHEAKNATQGGQPTSRYAKGNGAKLAAIDVQWKLAAVQPFTRNEDGVLSLTCTKDRRGFIHPRRYRMTVSRNLQVLFASDAERREAEAEDAMESLTPAEVKVMDCLTGNQAGIDYMIQRVKAKHKTTLRRETVSRALGRLAELGLAEQVTFGGGRGIVSTWVLARPDEPRLDEVGDSK